MLDPNQRIAARQLYRGIARLAREAKLDLRQPGVIRALVQGSNIETNARPETLVSLRNLLLLLGQELSNGTMEPAPPPLQLRSGARPTG